jgi:hypothetical protein
VKAVKRLVKDKAPDTYQPHPDPAQERLFFSLLQECLEKGIIDVDLVKREMDANHVRHDALELVQRRAARGDGLTLRPGMGWRRPSEFLTCRLTWFFWRV